MKRMYFYCSFLPLFLAAFLSICIVTTQVFAVEPEKITSVEGITEYRLSNGLRVLLFPDATQETMTVNITYLVGSRHEGYGETGMAHLLEHLMFKGTDKHRNIPQELSSRGARPNGTTSFDRTNYFETFPASDENLQWALGLEADRMVNSHIWKKDLDSEMTVVRNEFESGENSPEQVLRKRVLALMFDFHGYGHSPIGARSDIENVPIERLQAFYRRYYQPDNAVLTIAGKIDETKTLALVRKTFGSIPRPERKLIPTYTREPVQDGERTVTVRRVGDTQIVAVAYHMPSGVHPDAAAALLLDEVLGSVPSGRLHRTLVETSKATTAGSYFASFAEPGLIAAYAGLRKEQSIEEARKALLLTIDDLKTKPVIEEEVERARLGALKEISLAISKSDVLGLQLSEDIAKGDWRLFFLRRDQLKKVTAADLNRVAQQYLKPSNRTLAEFIPTSNPDRVEIPEAPDLQRLLAGYKGNNALSQGEAFDPSPLHIETRIQRLSLGGVSLALLPKKTRGDMVSVSLELHFGDAESLKDKSAVSKLAIEMLMRGSRGHTRQQLKDQFDRLRVQGGIGSERGELRAFVKTEKKNVAETLKLLKEIVREPAFPADELEQLRQEHIADIEANRNQPKAAANILINRHLQSYPKGDPRYTPEPDEAIAEYRSVTREQVRDFYDRFVGAAKVEVAIVGDFDVMETQKLVTEMFAGWTAKQPYSFIPDTFQAVAPIQEKIETPDKLNAVFIACQNLKLRDTDEDYPALVLGNYMLGGGFLNSRLATRIRQREGLSYHVSSGLMVGTLDNYGRFSVYAIHAPQNTGRLERAMREELERALKDGFSAEELEQAKKGWLQSRQLTRSDDRALANELISDLFLKRTLAWDADLEWKVAALTSEQIVSALRRHIDPAKLSIVRAGDFGGAK
jgi:zinc protease